MTAIILNQDSNTEMVKKNADNTKCEQMLGVSPFFKANHS